MATDTSASIIPLVQPKTPLTPAQRAKAYRDRKREAAGKAAKPVKLGTGIVVQSGKSPVTPVVKHANTQIADCVFASPVTPASVTPVTATRRVTLPRLDASTVLTGVAFGLAAVGVVMNGWFAHSLGSTDVAGWLFAAIGIAADLIALAVPTCAARLWQTRQRGSAAAGWAVWLATFLFAVNAGIGFASVNISDVTTSRASRVTPTVTLAQTAYSDALASRDKECRGGVGKFCREREAQVVERRQALEVAMRAVQATADPQTEAASKIVSWLTAGMAKPSTDDLAMLRLILLALLPQVGGVLLMVGRSSKSREPIVT